eukprot:CAMPEP_0114277454 /NCGR_PEP_ID=MMETSP0059-20121206/801_1 /TAXON_ID=36894 /ORGANISM="Pyramimonas parkeae, Strain CCMP726" /LENGTH=112 /DNA_ID=CAMNT_0001397565 /DNA_START=387 /DNA_END=721 /DNA_ORIENTATION=+
MTKVAQPRVYHLRPQVWRSSFRSSTWQLPHASGFEDRTTQETACEDGGEGPHLQQSAHAPGGEVAEDPPSQTASTDSGRDSVRRRRLSRYALGVLGLSAAFFVTGGAANATG